MLVEVSEGRWLAEPEAVMDEDGYRDMYGKGVIVEWRDGKVWVARMPSGALEWLTDAECQRLVAAFDRQRPGMPTYVSPAVDIGA